MMSDPMECHSIRPSDIPHTTRLFAAYLEDFSGTKGFYAHAPHMEGIQEAARNLSYELATREAVVTVLQKQNRAFGSDAATERNLDRLRRGAVAIVTGQQVGLFGGPCYSVYKALAAVRVAQQLAERGLDAVPVFWLATEDHDLAEVDHCSWLTREGVAQLRVTPHDAGGRRVGEIRLGEGIRELVQQAVTALEGPFAGHVSRALENSYGPDETFGSAFAKLFARLLAGRGLILLDPLDARLHRLAAPVYLRALEESEALSRALLARNRQLERAGFHAQVKVTERSTLLFLNLDGQRVALRRRSAGFQAGATAFSLEEVKERIGAHPEATSANVLLRPVIQDTLLPTVAYIAGPAEVAYFAQAAVIYERLLGRMPAVLPRPGFTIIEPYLGRLLKKYGLSEKEILRGPQAIRSKLERQFLTRALQRKFDADEKLIRRALRELRTPLRKLDRTLLGAAATAERKMLFQLERLRAKVGRAEAFRSGVLDRHFQLIVETLYPHHGLQERTLCFLPFLSRHGSELLDQLEAKTGLEAAHHQFLLL